MVSQILISAGLMKGKHATCYRSAAPEMKEAGGNYEDKEVIVDGNLIHIPSALRPPGFYEGDHEEDKEEVKARGVCP